MRFNHFSLKYRTSSNKAQLLMLLEFMEKNSDLAKGIVNGANGRDKANKLWDKIKEKLNEIGPPTRSVVDWKKVN